MRLFPKIKTDTSYDAMDGRMNDIENSIYDINLKMASMERKIAEIADRNYERIVWETLHELLRQKTISVLTTMNKKEVVASVVMDELHELEHKRGELERALDEVNHALDKAKKKKEEA